MRGFAIFLSGSFLLASAAAIAAPPGTDPDWPCRQRLVPELTATTFWNGPPLPTGADWHANSKVAAEVAAVAPRDVPVDDGVASLGRFAEKLKPAERKTVLPVLFLGIVEETNRQRAEIIARIKELAQRQRGIGDTVAKITTELSTVPATAEGDDAKRRIEIVQRRDFVIRSFEGNRTDDALRL
ncbi:MAG: hypothetical protein WDN69_07990 [Aliidongia sp.]